MFWEVNREEDTYTILSISCVLYKEQPLGKFCTQNINHFVSLFQNAESEHINLKVLGQDNAVVQFKIKKHTPLRKLMSAYCDRAVSQLLLKTVYMCVYA